MAFHVGPFMITWHGLFTALGLLASVYAARAFARKFGIEPDEVWGAAPYLAVGGMVGGRLAFVAAHLAEFRSAPWAVLRIDQGGLGSFGAIPAMIAAGYVYARVRRLPPWRFADALAIVIPINYLAMRIGSFFTGELYGDPTSLPWGVAFPGVAGLRHPVQFYDALLQVVLIAAVARRSRGAAPDGALFWWTLLWAQSVRFAMDLLRSEWRSVGVLTLGQVGALVLIALALAGLAFGKQGKAAGASDRIAPAP